jgi:hypothetical protein
VDWIGFDNQSNAWIGNPATTDNWFAATDATGIPAPVAGAQTMTISTGKTGLTAANFSVKAFSSSGSGISITNLSSVSGNGQSGTAGQRLANPFTVQVTGAGGAPVSGITVTFAVVSGGGTLSAINVSTDSQGLASSVLTLGATAGANIVSATSGTTTGSPVTFSATSTIAASPAANLVSVSGNGQSGTAGQRLASPFMVKVTDAGGSPVSGVSVTFAVVSGGGTLSAANVSTDSQGLASSLLTLGATAGANSVSATSGALAGSPITFIANAVSSSSAPVTWRKSSSPVNHYSTQYQQWRYDPIGQNTIMYQTDNGSIYSNGIWQFRATSDTIQLLGTSGSTSQVCPSDTDTWPGDRHPVGQTAIDTRRNVMWLSGGVCGSVTRTDVYQLLLNANPAKNTWRRLLPSHFPYETRGNTMVYDPNTDVLLSYGYDGGPDNHDTWVYCPTDLNPTPGTLSQVQVSAGCVNPDDWNEVTVTLVPQLRPPSSFPGMVYDTRLKKVILVGGRHPYDPVDTWTYDVPTRTWTKITTAISPPTPLDDDTLHSQSAVAYNASVGLLYLHDSMGPSDWTFNLQTNTWINLGNMGGPTAACVELGVSSGCGSETIAYDASANALIAANKNSSGLEEVWIGQLNTSAPPLASPATNLVSVTGNGQSAPAGQRLSVPFTVQATDASGTPVPGVLVTFTVVSGDGTLSAPQVYTDSQGTAASSLTLGPSAGTNTVTALSGTLAGSPLTFTATATVVSSCDLNLDGQVNVLDVQIVALQATKGCGTADLNHDGHCDQTDQQMVVNAVLGGGCQISPVPPSGK